MRIAVGGAGMQATRIASAVVWAVAFWLSALSCRAPGAGDGAGGQSGGNPSPMPSSIWDFAIRKYTRRLGWLGEVMYTTA